MQAYTMSAVTDFICSNYNVIDSVKVTKVVTNGFNEREGMNYLANIKIVTNDKYRNKFIQLATNSTYTQDLEEYYPYDDTMDYLEYLKSALMDYYNNLLL